jgi:hypothetical protein
MKALWDELDFLDPIPVCTCGAACTCGALLNLKNHRNTQIFVCFLRGLNDTYQTVRSQIMLIHPLPSINRVYFMIVQQER